MGGSLKKLSACRRKLDRAVAVSKGRTYIGDALQSDASHTLSQNAGVYSHAGAAGVCEGVKLLCKRFIGRLPGKPAPTSAQSALKLAKRSRRE